MSDHPPEPGSGDGNDEATRIAPSVEHTDEAAKKVAGATAPADNEPNKTPTGPAREHIPLARREFVPGDVFADRRIEAELGRGAMGIVYRVIHLKLLRTEALKIISPQYAADPEFRKRFEHEARHAAIVQHENVLRVFDAGEQDGVLYLAMEYVDGVDLGTMLAAGGALAPGLAARIVSQVAAALSAAHHVGLVHRDVKPANIIVSGGPGEEHAHLTDFGVSRLATGSDLTAPGTAVGTPHYTAPEVHQGHVADHRSDVYSLGCVLFEALTGRTPFPGPTATAVAIAHCQEPPPSPLDVDPSIPAGFELVVARALAKDPDSRYQTTDELGRDALAALHPPETVVVPPAPEPATPIDPPPREPATDASLLLAVVGAALLLTGIFVKNHGESLLLPSFGGPTNFHNSEALWRASGIFDSMGTVSFAVLGVLGAIWAARSERRQVLGAGLLVAAGLQGSWFYGQVVTMDTGNAVGFALPLLGGLLLLVAGGLRVRQLANSGQIRTTRTTLGGALSALAVAGGVLMWLGTRVTFNGDFTVDSGHFEHWDLILAAVTAAAVPVIWTVLPDCGLFLSAILIGLGVGSLCVWPRYIAIPLMEVQASLGFGGVIGILGALAIFLAGLGGHRLVYRQTLSAAQISPGVLTP